MFHTFVKLFSKTSAADVKEIRNVKIYYIERLNDKFRIIMMLLQFHGSNQVYLNDDWPSKDECDQHVQKVPDSRNLTSTYLSPENKGYE